MTPFFFGPSDRRLFGLFQPAWGSPSPASAVLLCNPFGQEALRTHRLYRVLADRLTRAGVAVLRFDYFATGDSAGNDAEGELAGWTNDLRAAHDELVRRVKSASIIWIGARLGATLAIKASATQGTAPDRLILWEPVVDGAAYLGELAERHMQTLETSYKYPQPPPWRAMLASGSWVLEREGVGFELGDGLRAQLCDLSPTSLAMPRFSRCEVIERTERPTILDIVQGWRRAGLCVNEVALVHDFDWLAAEALNTALVPAESVQLLVQLATDPK
jgi:uncharacterized protein